MNNKMGLSGVRVNDLIFYEFGLTESELLTDSDKVILACIKKAYRDMCRTITFTYAQDKIPHDKKEDYLKKKAEWKKNVEDLIVKGLSGLSEYKDQEYFDSWHKSLCNDIIKLQDNKVLKEKLTVGQAQKWVNMSIKYLYLLGRNVASPKVLHIPVDDFIIHAAAVSKESNIGDKVDVKGLGVKGDDVKPWSKIRDYEIYKKYQDTLRENYNPGNLVDWEEKAWMAESLNRNRNS